RVPEPGRTPRRRRQRDAAPTRGDRDRPDARRGVLDADRPAERSRRRARRAARGRAHAFRPVGVPRTQPGLAMQSAVTDTLEALLRDAFPEATEVRVTDRTGGG